MIWFNTSCRTAEDLSATSRRLARYETLLANIAPLVTPQIRVMIEEARQDVSPLTAIIRPATLHGTNDPNQEMTHSPGSDTTEGDATMSNSSSGVTGLERTPHGRLSSLPLSVGNTILPAVAPRAPQPPPSLTSYESIPLSSSGGSPQHPSSIGHGLHRTSEDMTNSSTSSLSRLPSIRPDGMLIEPTPPSTGSQVGTPAEPRRLHASSSEPANLMRQLGQDSPVTSSMSPLVGGEKGK